MKSPIVILMAVGLLVTPIFSGCRSSEQAQRSEPTESGQRVIKVSFRGKQGSFRMRINQHPIENLENTKFTNVMTQLQLDYGDIVIWEDLRNEKGQELSHPDSISRWWFKYLEGVRASFYSINSNDVTDFFATPIYHWKATPEKPRPIHDATFYVDGATLGRGLSGFQAMMDTIEKTKSGPVFILAPRIKNEGQASHWIADDQLLDWAKDVGISTQFEKVFYGRYSGQLDFGRLMDEQ